MRILLAIFIVLTGLNPGLSQLQVNSTGNTLNGKNIIDTVKVRYLALKNEYGKIQKIRGKTKNEFMYMVTTDVQPKYVYNLAIKLPVIPDNYEKGRVFLLSFDAKSIYSGFETGEAKVLFILRQSPSYNTNLSRTLSLSSEWKTYYIPFRATRDIDKKDLKLVMQFGYRPQAFAIKNIKFEVFPPGTKLAQLPKTDYSYPGMEENAPWRKEAFERIEKYRKGDFKLVFTKDGKPLAGKQVKIELKEHAFPFGAALSAKDVVNDTRTYENFKTIFKHTVLENDLKIKSWRNKKKRSITKKALKILKDDGIDVKGHVLIWPGFNYLPPIIKENKDNPQKVEKIILNHVKNILKKTKGYISHWDVVNEAYTNKDLQNITGSEEILYKGFELAKEIDPKALRFTNEYGIISNGGIDTRKQKWYYDFVKRIDEHTGGLVDGIGIQSHIGSDLTPPHRIVEILDFYSGLNKKISISEFSMSIKDPEIREKYTRDFLIATFSHPSVSEIIFWGFSPGKRNLVDIMDDMAIPGAMGRAFLDLTGKVWTTTLDTVTGAGGEVQDRGFYGKYTYILKIGGKAYYGDFTLDKGKENIINIEIK